MSFTQTASQDKNISSPQIIKGNQNTKSRLPCVFISHGLIGQTLDMNLGQRPVFKKYFEDNNLQTKVKTAIIISGHCEDNYFSINFKQYPTIMHDHPSEWLFKYKFHLETNLELSQKIKQRLEETRFDVRETQLDYVDHGAWGGLFHLFDIEEQQKQYDQNNTHYVPQIVEISLNAKADMETHFKLGQILNEFRDENTMIICSGATTHSFTYNSHPRYRDWSKEWEKMIIDLVTNRDVNFRNESFFKIKQHKMYSYINHSDDHFSPLLVALGTATEETPKLLYFAKNLVLYGSSFIFP